MSLSMSLSMATGKCQSLAMVRMMASFLSSAVVVLLDDDRAAVDDALHEHLHRGQDGHVGHAGHALGMQDLHSKVIGVPLAKLQLAMLQHEGRELARRLRGEHGGVQQVVGALVHQPAHVLGQQQQTRPRD